MAARILVYGGDNLIGQQFIRLLENAGVEYAKGTQIPAKDELIHEEIVKCSPSHVVLLLQHSDSTNEGMMRLKLLFFLNYTFAAKRR